MRNFRFLIIIFVFVAFTLCVSAYTGDMNGDFDIDPNDAALFSRYLAECEVVINLDNADINKDGKADSRDAIILLQYLAGMIDNLYSNAVPVEDACNYTRLISEGLYGKGLPGIYHSVVLPSLVSTTEASNEFNDMIIDRHYGAVEILENYNEKNVFYDIGYTYYSSNGIIGIMVSDSQTVADVGTTVKHSCYYFDTVNDRELDYFEYLEALGANYFSVASTVNSVLSEGERRFSTNYMDFQLNMVIIGDSAVCAVVYDTNGNQRSVIIEGSFVGKTAKKYDLSSVIETLHSEDEDAFYHPSFHAPLETFIADVDGDGRAELVARYQQYSYEYICAWKLVGCFFEDYEILSTVKFDEDYERAYMILDSEGMLKAMSIITRKLSDTETLETYYFHEYSDIFSSYIRMSGESYKIQSGEDGDVYYIDRDGTAQYSECSKEEYESYRDGQLKYIEEHSVSREKCGLAGVWNKQKTLLASKSSTEIVEPPISSGENSPVVSDAVSFRAGVSDFLFRFPLPSKNHTAVLPKINIDTEAAKAFNNRIYKKHGDPIGEFVGENTYFKFYDISYTYALCDNIIGILIRDSRSVVNAYSHCDYSGYYFDIEADRELNYFEYLEALGVNYSSLVYSLNSYIKKNTLGATYSTDYADYDIQTAIFSEDSVTLVLPTKAFKEEIVVLENSFTDKSEMRYDIVDVLERYYYDNEIRFATSRLGLELEDYFIADLDKNGTPELAVRFLLTSHDCMSFNVYVFDNGIVLSEYSFGEGHGTGYIEDLSFLFNEGGELVIFNISETFFNKSFYVDIEQKTWTEFGFDSTGYENVYLYREGEEGEEISYFYKSAPDDEYIPITEMEYYEFIEWMRGVHKNCIWPSGRCIWEMQKEIYASR